MIIRNTSRRGTATASNGSLPHKDDTPHSTDYNNSKHLKSMVCSLLNSSPYNKNMKYQTRNLVMLLLPLVGILVVQQHHIDYGAKSFENRPTVSAKSHSTHTPIFCEENVVQSYAVCNGFSNQMLGHAAFISDIIMEGKAVHIPDAFIFNGVQMKTDKEGNLKSVFANKKNSLPLTSIIDGDALLSVIRSHGVSACFVPHRKVVSFPNDFFGCGWLAALEEASDAIELDVLTAIKPSNRLDKVVQSTLEALQEKLPTNAAMSDGICLHHRDGPDWHNHCNTWQGNNCLNFEKQSIEQLVRNRVPAAYPKKWMYYVGDTAPSEAMIDRMKESAGLEVFHRAKDGLLMDDILREKFLGGAETTLEKHRDIYAAVDFFVCKSVSSFVGNSVSTFSALQIARREGKGTTWYNSRSNPLLAAFLKVQNIPIVYTYTEESHVMGKYLLKVSITSARQVFGMGIDINIMYHGKKDKKFLEWLRQRHVIIHNHEPNWLPMIDKMISIADHSRSHLYSHRGNYIGTWQRIDIPLFIREEYVILLDADTVIHKKFDLSSFGLEITPGIAITQESETDSNPANLGVALFNVPKLRETHKDFLTFIQNHSDQNHDFVLGPSDQGAYLDFYHSHKNPDVALNHEPSHYVQRLETVFNVKPHYTKAEWFHERFIVHFHGLKPHEVLKVLMGYPKEKFSNALHFLYDRIISHGERHELVCIVLHDFAVALVDDEDNMQQFCAISFTEPKERMFCVDYFKILATFPEDADCVGILGWVKETVFADVTLKYDGIKKFYSVEEG